jgi:hypothetical protein
MKCVPLSALASIVLCACGHSTQCYNISDDEAAATAQRALERLITRSSPQTGIPVTSARELSITKIERLTGEKGSDLFNVKIEFTRPGKPGKLIAFVYEDCVVGWSPQFDGKVAAEGAP